ncbi:hypothetical protein HF086_017820 [Spodoptera exigua]|uniref:Sulfatase N-terminal domain-containing protein n=1 Tax=Spodoptera exigua TaxID=7107 RepID=A0A922S8H8_SPOEX|nr:hypothetical protein HF086_017820 [Spodoptera exigua]
MGYVGWNDVSFHGSDQILTPNIDSLAYQSAILQQYYSEAICTPARTALLTGKYPMRLGMHGLPLFNSEDRGIPLTERLLPSYLKELGYATHLWPNGRLMYGLDLYDDAIPQETEHRYIVDALTDKAVKIIHYHNSSQPLFLHVTHNGPHAGNAGGALQPPLYSLSRTTTSLTRTGDFILVKIVTQIDRSVGKIVEALGDKGILEDTIIVFVSDNGAATVGELRNWGVNLPLRGKKYTPWEGAVRVPAFIWQASLRPKVWQGLMHISDWLPTLITAAGGRVPAGIDGVNQWESIMYDGVSKRKEVLITVEDSATNAWASYRAGDYKIIVGNVTGVSNGYYGAELMVNKWSPPDYFPALGNSDVTRVLGEIGSPWLSIQCQTRPNRES